MIRHKSVAGFALKILGTLIIIVSIIGFVASFLIKMGAVVNGILTGASVAFGIVGNHLITIGKRLHVEIQRGSLVQEAQSPVLYLRSFQDDDKTSAATGNLIMVTGKSEEQQFAKALSHFGPLIALGKPGQGLPNLGAVRKYIEDEDWHTEISRLMEKARLIVFRFNSSPGTIWELNYALQNFDPQKIVIYLSRPTKDSSGYVTRSLIEILENFTAVNKNEIDDFEKVNKKSKIGKLILFTADRKLKVVDLLFPPPYKYERILNSYEPVLTLGLKPVYDNLQLNWNAPRIGSKLIGLILFLSFFILAFMAIIIDSVSD